MFQFFTQRLAISPIEASKKNAHPSVCIIDVRSIEEFTDGHAKDALNIPLDEIQDRISEIVKYDEVYVICRSGGRSAQAASFLTSQGIRALNVSGGTLGWRDEGLPME